jgi:hypothetical protein
VLRFIRRQPLHGDSTSNIKQMGLSANRISLSKFASSPSSMTNLREVDFLTLTHSSLGKERTNKFWLTFAN